MKRGSEAAELLEDSSKSIKHAKFESVEFQKALLDETGVICPGRIALQGCTISTLKSICQKFQLSVAKSGGSKQRFSLKKDYVDAIEQQISSTLSLETPKYVAYRQPAALDAARTRVPQRDGEAQTNPVSLVVRLFKNPADYRTRAIAEKILSYDTKVGVLLRDIARAFGLEDCEVISPKGFSPLFLADSKLDVHLVALLTKNHGYVRVVNKLSYDAMSIGA